MVIRFLWGLGALEEANRERTRISHHAEAVHIDWRVDSHGCCKFNNADLVHLGHVTPRLILPVFLHLRTTNFPMGPDSITRSDTSSTKTFGTQSHPGTSDDKPAEDSLILQPPNVTVSPLRENTMGARELFLGRLTPRTGTRFQYGSDEADAMLYTKIT